ncbi:lysine decarboxylase [Halalkalibacillus sediminis]|uniref:Lysine decarboxylase n=1 Tax=Halalkalibacillus sediminis TaxID=2018042 RepID=A0A2I0QT12_9BACI|nr:aminotransferase class I/II-fold pyridoxal phosphate-dependent enzyme [Halalkalibacillus sediminis]PKR77477.1 lysine decarboxylase [Halalkalibacillus sediminis]
MNQSKAPLFEAISKHANRNPISFHVPGHKNGELFSDHHHLNEFLKYDLTELPELDDLHQPEGVIREAEQLAADFYGVDRTFFLVNGTTVGNLAMIMSSCTKGSKVLVQRNSHKSVMHGLELAGCQPIFFSPLFDRETGRYSDVDSNSICDLIKETQDLEAVILTYPDYFGSTYDLTEIIQVAHSKDIPVLIDEAHGAHFKWGAPFPKSAIDLGADVVVHSAHKSLPAMTMGSNLHICSDRVSEQKTKMYLQMLQSSSPSYPIMASLDLSRKYLAELTPKIVSHTIQRLDQCREILSSVPNFTVQPIRETIDDPLKITISSDTVNLQQMMEVFHEQGIYPEMIENNQLLLIGGLNVSDEAVHRMESVKNLVESVTFDPIHDKMNDRDMYAYKVEVFEYSFHELQQMNTHRVEWKNACGNISAETVTPYPPGIPVLMKGERITEKHVQFILSSLKENRYIQYTGENLSKGIQVFADRKGLVR